jgi:RNA polymerase sigma-70 factor (ECF subfamily)
VLAATVRVTRDLDLAEECVQEAFASALTDWRRSGVPRRPEPGFDDGRGAAR